MKKCVYDYQNSCTCAEDDKCGCDFDNNMAHDVSCHFEDLKNPKQPSDTTPQTRLPHHNPPK